MTVRTDTSLHHTTVTQNSKKPFRLVTSRTNRSGTWATPATLRQIDSDLLASATKAAGGDRDRLWFDNKGAVYILNHPRNQTCLGGGCPACKEPR